MYRKDSDGEDGLGEFHVDATIKACLARNSELLLSSGEADLQ